jgi:hypothetical protein
MVRVQWNVFRDQCPHGDDGQKANSLHPFSNPRNQSSRQLIGDLIQPHRIQRTFAISSRIVNAQGWKNDWHVRV